MGNVYDLDVVITSSSRPQLYPFMWKSFNDMITFRGNRRVLCHEDSVFPEQSNKIISWLEKLKGKGEIQKIYKHKPAIGLGMALTQMIGEVKSKYMFYIQEDWEFERPIDVDQILWVMDKNPNINLIYFNKIRNSGTINKCEQREYTFDGLKMCLSHGWNFLPGIWRMDFVRKHWRGIATHPEGFFTNTFGTHEQRKNVKHCYDKMGAFIYGHTGDFRYVRHIGNDWRTASWRLENGKPSGRHDDAMDIPYMADWLPAPPKRPIFKKDGWNAK